MLGGREQTGFVTRNQVVCIPNSLRRERTVSVYTNRPVLLFMKTVCYPSHCPPLLFPFFSLLLLPDPSALFFLTFPLPFLYFFFTFHRFLYFFISFLYFSAFTFLTFLYFLPCLYFISFLYFSPIPLVFSNSFTFLPFLYFSPNPLLF